MQRPSRASARGTRGFPEPSLKTNVRFRLNGKPTVLHTDDERHLLWVLRTELNLTGTKYGCGSGYCGACTVLVGREAVRSCRTTLKQIEGKEVVTIEGLASAGKLHPLQRAFMEHGGFQCGYCTSGMIMSACALCPWDMGTFGSMTT